MFEGKFKLDDKHCDLGIYLNGPTQKHGDERLPAKVIGVKNVPLGKDELNDFFGDKHAWDMLYVESKGKPAIDFWKDKLGKLPLAISKFKGSNVALKFGLKPYEVTFADCTVKSCEIERTEGGVTMLSFTVVGLKSNISGDLARLDEYLSKNANVCVDFGDPADEGEDGDEDSDPELDLDHQAAANGNVKKEKVDTSTHRRKSSDGTTLNA